MSFNVPAGNAWAVSDEDAWADGTIVTNPADTTTVTEGETLSVASFTTGGEIAVDKGDYTVLYFHDADGDGELAASDDIVTDSESITKRPGEMPATAGSYVLVVIDNETIPAGYFPTNGNTFQTWLNGNISYAAKAFKVVKATKSIEGAYAYQGDETPTAAELADTTFNYTGGELQVMFAVDGEPIQANVEWTDLPDNTAAPVYGGSGYFPVKNAGTYVAKLVGINGWSGEETVEFTVEDVNLSEDEVTAIPTEEFYADTNARVNASLLTINGEQMDQNAELTATVTAFNGQTVDPALYSQKDIDVPGRYTVRVEAVAGSKNVTGATNIDLHVVSEMAKYAYNGNPLTEDAETDLGTFDAAKGTYFTKSAFTAKLADGTDVMKDTDIVVTKDGVETDDFTQPGVYKGVISTAVAANHSYAGYETFTFEVMGTDYTGSTVYASWQGKNVEDDENFEYTGSAIAPSVVVKDAEGELLTEGKDYTVAIEDAKSDAVEPVEVGDYYIVVTFNGKYDGDWNGTEEIHYGITPAVIESAEATQEYYALPEDGSAATPAFIGYTEPGLKGQAFELAAGDIDVVYYEGKWQEATTNEAGKWVPTKTKVDELTETGVYFADINIKSTVKNLVEVSTQLAPVQVIVTDKVSFDDVDANAWYAEEVYKAAKNEYVQGMGNKLFFPDAQMTRAQFAQVLYNMAGETGEWGTHPTQFTDVTADAWYAEAVSWAVEAGVVKGTSETTFDPEGNITREQIATMLYRYAGNGAQADLSVLDAFVDGGEVCDWAETAMAWAVESGHMNGKGANDLQPHANATRAEVAALSVRVQPEPIEKPII